MNYKAPSSRLNIWLSPLADERIYLSEDDELLSLSREFFDVKTGKWANDDSFDFPSDALEPLLDALQLIAGKQSAKFCGGVNISGLKEPIE